MTRIFLTSAMAICAATSLAAQDATCAGIDGPGQWIGGTADGSDITTVGAFREQMALVLNGNRYAGVFSVSAPTATRIEAQGRGNGDPVLTLYGPDGEQILTDDDSGGNGAARAELDLTPGTYCAVVASYDDAPMTAFVRIGRTEMDALTEGADEGPQTDRDADNAAMGNGCADALDMGTLGMNGGPLTTDAVPDRTDAVSFTLSDRMAFSVTASNERADPVITLETSGGEVLGDNDDYDGLNARIDISDPQDAGSFCITLEALDDASLPVTVAVSVYDPVAAIAALYARGEAAPPTDGSYDITDLGPIAAVMRMDVDATQDASWFSLGVPDAGLLVIEAIAIGPTGDPWLAMYDQAGRQVAQNDDSGDGVDAFLTARVSAGTYLVGLKQVGGAQGFVRLLMERYVPAD